MSIESLYSRATCNKARGGGVCTGSTEVHLGTRWTSSTESLGDFIDVDDRHFSDQHSRSNFRDSVRRRRSMVHHHPPSRDEMLCEHDDRMRATASQQHPVGRGTRRSRRDSTSGMNNEKLAGRGVKETAVKAFIVLLAANFLLLVDSIEWL